MRKEKIMEIGEKHNFLTCISQECVEVNNRGERHKHAIFKCDCGNEKKIQCSFVRRGKSKSCGKTCRILKTRPYRARKIGEPIKIGDKFGFLTVKAEVFIPSKKNAAKFVKRFDCECECGTSVKMTAEKLRNRVQCGRRCELGNKRDVVKKSKHVYFVGQKINRLTVISPPYYITENRNGCNKRVKFIKCQCDCGEKIEVKCRSLNEKTKKECGACTYDKKSKSLIKGTQAKDGFKTCGVCKQTLQTSHFYKSKSLKDGFLSKCISCLADKKIKQAYGISMDIYQNMVNKQNGQCAICKKGVCPESKINRRFLCVDHDHSTGKVRGLLCASCNQAIGLLKESVSNLENAISYLKEHNNENSDGKP